jgi:hypothetical protein
MTIGLNATTSAEIQERRPRRRRLWTILAFVLLGLGVAFIVTAEVLVHRAAPIVRARVINTLSTRFDSRVELPELDISVWKGLEATGKGLKLYPRALDTDSDTGSNKDQPIFSVGEFSFRTHWWNLLRSPMHISEVSLSDLEIYRPTKEQRRQLAASNPPAQEAQRKKIEIIADEILIGHALLRLGTDKPGKSPLEFNIQSVRLNDVGANQPLRFHAILVNPKPVGNIDSSGYFGPYDVHEPGNSPVRGDYSFSHADLNTIKGIGGMLSSTGQYAGRLNQITVDGTTDTPNFSLDVSGSRPVPLHTKFHAVVDGMNGNTYLQPVDATLGHSHILARGAVTRAPKPGEPGQFGRRVQLDIIVGPADIADMLRLAVKTSPPVLRGALQLTAVLDLPPGPETVPHRMHLKGRFTIRNGTFSNEKIQKDLEQLSLRGQGRPHDAKTASVEGLHSVESQMQGNFDLAEAKMTLTGLDYSVPGAHIALNGIYTLDGSKFDFHGTARLEAKLSQMVTGWRSLLLMPVDPFFSKHGAGTEVPFTVSGTKGDPKFGLDIFHRDKQDKQPADSTKQH